MRTNVLPQEPDEEEIDQQRQDVEQVRKLQRKNLEHGERPQRVIEVHAGLHDQGVGPIRPSVFGDVADNENPEETARDEWRQRNVVVWRMNVFGGAVAQEVADGRHEERQAWTEERGEVGGRKTLKF